MYVLKVSWTVRHPCDVPYSLSLKFWNILIKPRFYFTIIWKKGHQHPNKKNKVYIFKELHTLECTTLLGTTQSLPRICKSSKTKEASRSWQCEKEYTHKTDENLRCTYWSIYRLLNCLTLFSNPCDIPHHIVSSPNF